MGAWTFWLLSSESSPLAVMRAATVCMCDLCVCVLCAHVRVCVCMLQRLMIYARTYCVSMRERGAASEQLAAGQAGVVTLRGNGGRLA